MLAIALAAGASATAAPVASAATNNIFTVAGTGTNCPSPNSPCGDGSAATAAQLADPSGVAVTADGGFLIADYNTNRIRRVSPSGTITTVAGTGTSGFEGDGGPATAAKLANPTAIVVTADGGFLFVDSFYPRVRRVSPGGTITTVAGTGTAGSTGDGGPATSAQISSPGGLAETADGGFLIADGFGANRVRRVSPGGTISTVAGGGAGGDGGQAIDAALSFPNGVAVTADGGFLIAEFGGARVRRVSPGGIISTVAGTGTAGFSGDGGPATAAQLDSAADVAITADGGFLVADYAGQRVRRVSAGGTITTVAGTGTACGNPTTPCGDQGPATAAQLKNPVRLAVTPSGGFLLADQGDHRIRFVDADLRPGGGPPGASGSASAQGAGGTQGVPGSAGAAGAAGARGADIEKPILVILADRLRSKQRRSLALRYLATTKASIRLDIMRGTKRVARLASTGKAGKNRITLRAPAAGRYTIILTATDANNQRATDRVALTVTR